jgi:hypothetical protein
VTAVPDRARFDRAVAAIDAAHAEDPARERVDGVEVAAELAYARRMTAWLERLAPDAPEALRLAVRCQHLRRWTLPREDYPMDRAGYRRWRARQSSMHAGAAARILQDAGYDAATIERVRTLVRKEGLTSDPEVQVLEDAACLVFLETGLDDLARRMEEEKLAGVLRKTWAKMSPAGRESALGLALDPALRALVERALSGSAPETKEDPNP